MKAKRAKKGSQTVFHYFVGLTVLYSSCIGNTFSAFFHMCSFSLVAYPEQAPQVGTECFSAWKKDARATEKIGM